MAVAECRERYAAFRPTLMERSQLKPQLMPANMEPTKLEVKEHLV